MYSDTIPIWQKAVLTAQEASELSGLDVKIIRAHGHLALLGQSEFPSFFVGNHMKVHRELFIEWLAEMAKNHNRFEIKLVNQVIAEAKAKAKRGRPRKERVS